MQLGYRELRLGTKARLPEALALYRSSGYRPVAPYTGPWREAADPRWLGKVIDAPPGRPAPYCAADVRPAPGWTRHGEATRARSPAGG